MTEFVLLLLVRFLYRKLQAHIPEDPETIFEEAPSRKLRVKPGITFHLYITTAPCGDGALMSQRYKAELKSIPGRA